ncbi:hypothetical protein VI817_009727 [Penicillium citrinum]|nr:hypothetical protein VI817_009727 [Penicillium citrinum]
MIGSFLTPMAAGTQATNQGWRWSYYTMGIFNSIFLLLFLFVYEETKYIPVLAGSSRPGSARDDNVPVKIPDGSITKATYPSVSKCSMPDDPSTRNHHIDPNIPRSKWSKRLALVTPTAEPIWPYYYRPFQVLFTFPAVMYAGLQYAAGVAWLTILSNVLSLVFPLPPYGFTPQQIGFMSLGPFIGNLIGAVYGGFLGDWSILHFSRRNKGFYEPEMRLYILHIPALAMAGGLIMFGATGMHWIYPSVGGALFGFGLGSIGDASLTLITGDAFTGIAFLRNAISIGIPFAITPWMERNGLQNMFIACGFISLGISSLAIPMVFWGKAARRGLATRYHRLVEQQGGFGVH